MEIDKEKFDNIFTVYKKFFTVIAASSGDPGRSQGSAAILTQIYFHKDINYKELKDSIRDGIEEANPLHGYDGPL